MLILAAVRFLLCHHTVLVFSVDNSSGMQEVVGDDRSALQAVVAADVELMELREEEEQLNKQLQETSLEDRPKGFDADEASERLNEVRMHGTHSLASP